MNNPCTSGRISYVKTGRQKPLKKFQWDLSIPSPGIATFRVEKSGEAWFARALWRLPAPVACTKWSCPPSQGGHHWQDVAWLCWKVLRTEAPWPVLMPCSPQGETAGSSAEMLERKGFFFREILKKYDSRCLNMNILFSIPAFWVNKMSKKPHYMFTKIFALMFITGKHWLKQV